MTTNAFSSGITVKFGDAASPEVFTAIEECFDLSGLGEVSGLIEATHFASTAKEYIADLADGSEITISCNKVQTASSIQSDVISAQSATRNFQVDVTDGTTSETYSFSGVVLGWTLTPSISDRNVIEFTVKISGSITIA